MADYNNHISTIALEDMYEVNGSGVPVQLDVQTGGQGQSALTTIKLNKTIKAKDIEGSMKEPLPLGANSELGGKVLRIKTMIVDLSRATNDTFIDITITGGPADYRHRIQKTVASEGDSVLYTANIEFFTR